MRQTIDDLLIPAHWTEIGMQERVGGYLVTMAAAEYTKYFRTEWNDGADCSLGVELFPQCSEEYRTQQTCGCSWTLPDSGYFADKTVPRYDVKFKIGHRTASQVRECQYHRKKAYYYGPNLPMCIVERGEALVTLSVLDREWQQ